MNRRPARGRRPQGVRVVYRRMDFEFEKAGVDTRWHGGSAFVSYFWNALSMSFPPGERFFIDAARAVRSQIEDPELEEELEQFIRQEAHHSFQHRQFNRLVGEAGFNVARYEGRFARALQRAADALNPMQKLAVTVALEHFTATLSREWLTNADLAKGADSRVVALWQWHCAEEIEHKATCFDLYERLGGSARTRIRAARRAWLLILSITFYNLIGMLREDGQLFDLRDHAKGLWHLLGPRGLITKMLPGLLAYLSDGYHPWQEDDSAALGRWREENARYIKH